LGIAAVAALSLSACGRNGALEIPPGPSGFSTCASRPERVAGRIPAADTSAAQTTSHEIIARTGFDAHGNPAAAPGQKRPFLRDPLLQ
jgi:hypothetical protein